MTDTNISTSNRWHSHIPSGGTFKRNEMELVGASSQYKHKSLPAQAGGCDQVNCHLYETGQQPLVQQMDGRHEQ